MSVPPERLAAALADRYHLEREVGAGGMATVYLGHDLRHDRRVAIKVLRPELGAVIGADRFLSEIRTTANLQHPHILPLHDSGEAAGLLWYAMPYVEGESLRDRLTREKQLPVADAVRIASEVAGALDFAHRHGVIHRDIKPENVLLQDGRALIADFGIALAARRADTGGRMTETGMSLGTPHYMSPEQAMGERELDARSDVYALGAMTYELLAGEPPFTGPNAQAIVAKVMTAEPEPVTSYRKTVPPNVAAAVATALEKLPADRFPTAAGFADALTNPAYRGTKGAAHPSTRLPVRLTAALAAALLLATTLALWGWLRETDTPDGRRFGRHWLDLPVPISRIRGAAIAPDGGWLVIHVVDSGAAFGSGRARIWARPWHEPDFTAVPGTEGATSSAFAPDGRRLAFATEEGLKRVTLGEPTAPVTLLPWSQPPTGRIAWATDGHIYGSSVNVVWRVPEAGGAPDTVAQAPSGQGMILAGALPHGGLLLHQGNLRIDSLAVLDPATGAVRALLPGHTPQFVSSGHLIYITANQQLAAVAFDAERLEVRGSPRVIVEGVLAYVAAWNGSMMYLGGRATLPGPEVAIVGPDGDEAIVDWPFEPGARLPDAPAVSPDGTHLAVAIWNPDTARVFIKRLDRGAPWPLLALHQTSRPAWSADGQWVGAVSASWRDGGEHLLRRRVGGSGETLTLSGPVDGNDLDLGHWSLDQPVVVGTPTGLAVLRLGQDSVPVPRLTTGAPHENPALSPDGRWLAFEMRVGNEWRVFIRPYPDLDRAFIPVSDGEANDPAWSADGRSLYYAVPVADGLDIEAARLDLGATLAVTRTERVAPLHRQTPQQGDGWYFAVMPGRDRFVVVRYAQADFRDIEGIVLVDNLDLVLDTLLARP